MNSEFFRAVAEGFRQVRAITQEVRRTYKRLGKIEAWFARHPPTEPPDWGESPEHRAWRRMIAWCTKPKSAGYAAHGGRGIRVDPRWKNFLSFLLDMGPRPRGHVLTRINIHGDFTPANCKWSTTSQLWSRRRPRNTRLTTFNGELRSLPRLAREVGVRYDVLYARVIRRGQPVEEAIRRALRANEALSPRRVN